MVDHYLIQPKGVYSHKWKISWPTIFLPEFCREPQHSFYPKLCQSCWIWAEDFQGILFDEPIKGSDFLLRQELNDCQCLCVQSRLPFFLSPQMSFVVSFDFSLYIIYNFIIEHSKHMLSCAWKGGALKYFASFSCFQLDFLSLSQTVTTLLGSRSTKC